MTIGQVPGAILAIFGLLALVASSVVVVRSALTAQQLTVLRSSNTDLQNRVTFLEHEDLRKDAEWTAKYAEIEKELAAEKAARQVLEATVTGKEELSQVLAILQAHDRRAARIEGKVTKTEEAAAEILTQVKGGNDAG